ncbi:MAG TPA: arginine decarboxylase, pyruvoyl-dependent [Candidatus Binatia bacterium]
MVPKKMFLTKGVGVHKEKLASFELALRAAGLAHCNLVLVSSIYPPGCKIISKEEGLKLLRPGEIIFAVYDRESNNEPNRLIAASVGLAVPADPSMHGYLSEHHSFGETDEKAGEYAEDLAASMLATTVGIEFNPELDWDEREHLFKMSGKIVRTSNVTQSAVGNKDGLWTTVFAAAVFINDDNLPAESGNGDATQDETARQVPEAREPAARQPEEAAKPQVSGNDEKTPHHHLRAARDQQEVAKALHRASEQELERSAQGKDPTPAEESAGKAGRTTKPA